jgi:DNA-binding NtrC family response regulator
MVAHVSRYEYPKEEELPPDYFEPPRLRDEPAEKTVFAVTAFVPLKDLALQYVEAVLAEVGHNKTRAAKMLGVDRRTLYRILTRGRVGNVSKY